jgi:hypothetical protein
VSYEVVVRPLAGVGHERCIDGLRRASEQATVTQTVTTEAAPSTPSPEDAGAPSGAGESSGKVRVPNVVGKDHQLAQDTMQARPGCTTSPRRMPPGRDVP